MKKYFKKWWFIAIIAAVLILIAGGIIIRSKGSRRHMESGKEIQWEKMKLGNLIPEPPVTRGEFNENSDKKLWLELKEVSYDQYTDYVSACTEKGFTVEAKETSDSYIASNSESYHLDLHFYESFSDDNIGDLHIILEAPVNSEEFSTISWPSSTAGGLLPVPNSTIGKFESESDNGFKVNIGNTSKADYDAYVSACMDSGFTVDYDKKDTFYSAYNADKWHLSVSYENNIMNIEIYNYGDIESDNDASSNIAASPTEKPTKKANKSEEGDEDITGLNPDFKKAMDSYEKFMDEYIAFMKKYYESDEIDADMLSKYREFMNKYSDCMEDFEKWKDKDMSSEELQYYLKVQTRVNEKLSQMQK